MTDPLRYVATWPVTDWIANGITITFGVTATVIGIVQLRKDSGQGYRPPNQAAVDVAPYTTSAEPPPGKLSDAIPRWYRLSAIAAP